MVPGLPPLFSQSARNQELDGEKARECNYALPVYVVSIKKTPQVKCFNWYFKHILEASSVYLFPFAKNAISLYK